MKNLLLFSLISLMGVGAFSQKEGITLKEARKIMKTAIYQTPNDIVVNSNKVQKLYTEATLVDPDEECIGMTYYDLQSNKLLQNRIYRWEDGCIGAVWIRGVEQPPNFPDRGTGYSFYNGTTWQFPVNRLESDRTIFPSYGPLGPNGEIVVSQGFDNGTDILFILTREEKGVGDWFETIYTGSPGPGDLVCGRVTTSGPDRNIIHLLANTYLEYLGQTSAMVYSRSPDAGQTWDIQNVVLEGTGINYYSGIGMNENIWADERNGTIAFLVADMWHDMFMMKSEDNGNTWQKTVIWEHPYPFFDWNTTITDTFFCVDNSASIALDADGKAHVVFGITRVGHFEAGTWYNYWPYCDGIGYWNEDMDVFSNNIHALSPPDWGYPNTEMIEDYNFIGWTQDIDGDNVITFNEDIFSYPQFGVSTMPTITVDDAGYIFVLYSSTTETYVYMDYNYKHIWGRARDNDGEWYNFHDLTSSIFHIVDECIYPQLASNSDENIHYFYQFDQIPGLALFENHEYSNNTEVYGTIEKECFFPSNYTTQIININPGFQFVSSKVSPVSPNMEIVAANIMNDDLEYIRNSTGAMLRKIGTNWVNGIGDWVDTEGYLIKTSASGVFLLNGWLIDPTTPIQLIAGFQFVSYLHDEEMDALEAFASIIGDDLIYVRNSVGAMLRKIGPNWVNGIGNCIPTEGYLVKMTTDAELVYPTDGVPASVTSVEKLGDHWNVQGNPAEAIWALYIGGAMDYVIGELEAGDEIAIFDGDLAVGCFTLTQVCTPENQLENDLNAFSQLFDGPGYTIGNPISFKAWKQNIGIEFYLFYFFTNPYGDAYEGDVFPEGEPYSLITFEGHDNIYEIKICIAIYPNPATNTLNINANTEVTNIKVLNYLGQTIDNINVNGMKVTINTSTYDAGIYFIQIETEKGISNQKIVIE